MAMLRVVVGGARLVLPTLPLTSSSGSFAAPLLYRVSASVWTRCCSYSDKPDAAAAAVGADRTVRLNRLMADRQICSRTEADALIEKKWVKLAGKIVTLPAPLIRQDTASYIDIELTSEARIFLDSKATILLNKPVGYASSQPESNQTPA